LKTEVQKLQNELAELKNVTLPEALEAKALQISDALKAAPAPATPSSDASTKSSAGDWVAEIPYEQPPYARIGNLGWDAEPSVLLPRAKEVLEKCGIQPSDYKCLSAVREKGSVVGLTFTSPARLQQAKREVAALNHTCAGMTKPVWLNVEKSRAELAPARLIHRATDMLTEVESTKPDPKAVEKILNGKQIKIDHKMIAWSFQGRLQWSKVGRRTLHRGRAQSSQGLRRKLRKCTADAEMPSN